MIRAGTWVVFETVPAWVVTLPEESQRVFRFCLGRTYRVDEIDKNGRMILDVSGDIDHRFGGFMNDIRLEPQNLREVL